MDFLKSYWRVLSLMAVCITLAVFGQLRGAPENSKETYTLLAAGLAALLAAHLAIAFDSIKLREKLDGDLAKLLSQHPDEVLLQVAKRHRHKLDAADVETVWYELCVAMQRHYKATNYVDLRSMYRTRLAQAAIAVQKAKIDALGLSVTKIFVVDSVEEASCSPDIRDQKRAKIAARYMLRGALEPRGGRALSIDFAIFDDQVVLEWTLDGRRIVAGKVIDVRTDPSGVEAYIKLFGDILSESHTVDGAAEPETVLQRIALVEAAAGVATWPQYKSPFEEFNYALTADNGWLTMHGAHPSLVYGLYRNDRLRGFSILDSEPRLKKYGHYEYYVAIHPDETRNGLAQLLTAYTAAEARRAKRAVFLRVRLDHPAASLYERCGFEFEANDKGRVVETEVVAGKSVDFHVMKLKRT